MTAPAKGLPFSMFNSARVNAALLEDIFMLCREIFADNRHYAHVREIAGGKSKVGPGAAEDVFGAARRSADVIESNRTDDDYAHLWCLALVIPSRLAVRSLLSVHDYKYFPIISFSLSRVATGILARSVRIACASVDPHLHVRSFGIAATASRTT